MTDQHLAEDDQDLTIDLLRGAPDTPQQRALRQLASAAQDADGAPPFGDQTWVELSKGNATTAYAWVTPESGDPVLAAAAVVVAGSDQEGAETAEAEPDVLELVVHPDHRGSGIATHLGQALQEAEELRAEPARPQRAWAHGGHPGAPRLAENFGWKPVRELWVMRLENSVELPQAELAEGVQLRSFQPGVDEQRWLEVNAAAFADHPEQGSLTLEDLEARKAEDWFSAEGFLMAWEPTAAGEELLGFHWTKIPTDAGEHIGEVYVVGVSPTAQGRGLGAALTVAGIDHLRRQGVDAVILYVDAGNTAAVKLYQKLGFEVWKTDTQYAP